MSCATFQTLHDATTTRHARPRCGAAHVEVSAGLPVRADLAVDPRRFRGILARQIRQDTWRKLARVRGLLPIVTVCGGPGTDAPLTVTLGARLAGSQQASAYVRSVLARVLTEDGHIQRWLRHAERVARC
ncbi:MAG: hypothetical protein AAF245_13560 [Pseudomonadota bacterium]